MFDRFLKPLLHLATLKEEKLRKKLSPALFCPRKFVFWSGQNLVEATTSETQRCDNVPSTLSNVATERQPKPIVVTTSCASWAVNFNFIEKKIVFSSLIFALKILASDWFKIPPIYLRSLKVSCLWQFATLNSWNIWIFNFSGHLISMTFSTFKVCLWYR